MGRHISAAKHAVEVGTAGQSIQPLPSTIAALSQFPITDPRSDRTWQSGQRESFIRVNNPTWTKVARVAGRVCA
jgi:cation transport regulator ChaC